MHPTLGLIPTDDDPGVCASCGNPCVQTDSGIECMFCETIKPPAAKQAPASCVGQVYDPEQVPQPEPPAEEDTEPDTVQTILKRRAKKALVSVFRTLADKLAEDD